MSRQDLETQFAGIDDGELLRRIGSGELSELAADVAQAEARKRNLALEAIRMAADSEAIEVAHGHGPLRLCARYFMPLDAQVLAARLQAEGLAARVMDADSVYAVGALFASLPRGGVRVMVPESQLADAIEIRQKFDAGEYAIDDDFDPNP